MVVRLPGPDEPASFGPPIVAPATDGAPHLPEGAKAALARMQARDDALFIATALAGLTARQRAGALAAKGAAQAAEEGGFDGYARRLDAEFAADVKRTVAEKESFSGPRPSEAAIGLFRRRAESVRRMALARNAVVEDGLRRAAQQRSLETGIESLAAAVAAEPEALGEALERLSDLTGAAAGLIGVEPAAALDLEAGARLASDAARAMIARDPADGLAAIQGGAFDDRLNDAMRARLSHEAESLSQAAGRDAAQMDRKQAAEAARRAEARALAFTGDFRRRLTTGEASHAEIEAAQADGALARGHAETLSAVLDESLAARAAEEAELLRVGAAILDGRILDAAKPEDRAAAALYFDAAMEPVLADLPPRQRAEAISDYVAATEIAPDGALRALAGMVIAGEAADRVHAARALTDLIQRHAPGDDVLPSGILRLAGDIAALAGFRIPPEKAIEFAEVGRYGFLAQDPEDGPLPDLPLVPGADITALAHLKARLEANGEIEQAGLLGRILNLLRRRRPSRPPRQEPENRRRPGIPVPPLQREEGEKSEDGRAPDPDHNGPSTEDGHRGVRDVELRPGVTVRGDPSSNRWKRFTGALDRLTGKSREAADGLVNGGELTTRAQTRPHISNITRQGTLDESLREFEKAVERAGGAADDIKLETKRNVEIRRFEAEDGTRFLHRVRSKTGPTTVDIHIEKPQMIGVPSERADEVKIRFEPPDGSGNTDTQSEGSGND